MSAAMDTNDDDLLNLEELCARVGISVRNVRFYTARGLVPPPIRRGRSGFYSPDHVARLELVKELQSHGFTLAAIEKYLAGVPEDAGAAEIALRRTMLAPWHADASQRMTRTELGQRSDRELTDVDLETLEAMGVIAARPDGAYDVQTATFSVAVGLLDLGFPVEAARIAQQVYTEHGRAVAHELYDVFRKIAWPAYQEAGLSPDQVREVVERLKPLSIASLVTAFEVGMDETRRERISRRSR